METPTPTPTPITATRRPCFAEEDDGLASIAGTAEPGFSGNSNNNNNNHCAFFSRRTSVRGFLTPSTSSFSPRSPGLRFYDARFEEHQPHFLEACALCKKPLSENKDIFMYKGDTPFCSEECRSEQIEVDEATEKNWSLSSMKALRKKNQEQRKSSSPSKTRDYSYRTGTIAAA